MQAFFNGRYVRKDEEVIRLEDRGLTFADGLFEVLRTASGKPLFFQEHIERMIDSSIELGIDFPYAIEEVRAFAEKLIEKNGLDEGELYIELTRGCDINREHRFPPKETPPTFFMLAIPLRKIDPNNWKEGAKVVTYEDLRHKLCIHKTLNLLPNILAKNHAYAHRGYEALMFRRNPLGKYITEGGSSSYFCVSGGKILTPEIDNILPGITRSKTISIAKEKGYEIEERRILLDEVLVADEVFLVSTVSKVMPIRQIDNRIFRAPGETTLALMELYEEVFQKEINS